MSNGFPACFLTRYVCLLNKSVTLPKLYFQDECGKMLKIERLSAEQSSSQMVR